MRYCRNGPKSSQLCCISRLSPPVGWQTCHSLRYPCTSILPEPVAPPQVTPYYLAHQLRTRLAISDVISLPLDIACLLHAALPATMIDKGKMHRTSMASAEASLFYLSKTASGAELVLPLWPSVCALGRVAPWTIYTCWRLVSGLSRPNWYRQASCQGVLCKQNHHLPDVETSMSSLRWCQRKRYYSPILDRHKSCSPRPRELCRRADSG